MHMKRKNTSEISAHNFVNYLSDHGELIIRKDTNDSERDIGVEKYQVFLNGQKIGTYIEFRHQDGELISQSFEGNIEDEQIILQYNSRSISSPLEAGRKDGHKNIPFP